MWETHGFKPLRIIGMVIAGLFVGALVALICGFVAMWLWNWLMPALFRLSAINYWQAFGLVLLGHLLFGSLGSHSRYRHFRRYHGHPGCHPRAWQDSEHWEKYGEEWKQRGERWRQFGEKWRRWDLYHDWWREAGKAAFEKYRDSRQKPPEQA